MNPLTTLAVALLPAIPSAPAVETKESARTLAVIIGISNYADPQILPRPRAEDDARALGELLLDREILGLGGDCVRLLLGQGENVRGSRPATREGILRALDWLAEESRPGDQVILAFFGQGASLGERGNRICYFGSDATLAGRARNAVAATEIAESLQRLPERRIIVMLDVGFNHLRPKMSLAQVQHGPVPFREFLGEEGEHDPAPGRALFAAGEGLVLPPDLDKHGLFASVILAGLRGAADREGGAADGFVTQRELAAYLKEQMAQREQEPVVILSDAGRSVLTRRMPFTDAPAVKAPMLAAGEAETYAKAVSKGGQLLVERYAYPLQPRQVLRWAVEGLYEHVGEPVPSALIERLDKVIHAAEPEALAVLTQARQQLGRREELDRQWAVTVSLRGITRHLDSFTSYIDPDQTGSICDFGPILVGVGLELRKDVRTGLLQIVTPMPDSPAHKAGLLPGDLITTIVREEDTAGKPLDPPEVFAAVALTLKQAQQALIGEQGTKVKLIVERDGEAKPREFVLTRASVAVPTVCSQQRKADGSWNYLIDEKQKIGYVRITAFRRDTADELAAALKGLQTAGMRGLVLDLRFNPGGLLMAAVKVADLFVASGPLVTIRTRAGQEETWEAKQEGSLTGFPIVVLINGSSASASELVAACLQDSGRARVVGERSGGKGSFRNVLRLNEGELKFTTALLVRPGGKSWNRPPRLLDRNDWGVVPDKSCEVELSPLERSQLEEHLRDAEILPRPGQKIVGGDFKDAQLTRALEVLIKLLATPRP